MKKVTFWLGDEDFVVLDTFAVKIDTEKAELLDSAMGSFWIPKNISKAYAVLGRSMSSSWRIDEVHDFLIFNLEGLESFFRSLKKQCSSLKICIIENHKIKGTSLLGELAVQWDRDLNDTYHSRGTIKISVPLSKIEKMGATYFVNYAFAKKKCFEWNLFSKQHNSFRVGLCPLCSAFVVVEAAEFFEKWKEVVCEAQLKWKTKKLKEKNDEYAEFLAKVDSIYSAMGDTFCKNDVLNYISSFYSMPVNFLDRFFDHIKGYNLVTCIDFRSKTFAKNKKVEA